MAQDWHLCEKCGDKEYPNADKNKWGGITVMTGTCPLCKQEKVTLIPRSDYEYAEGDESKWD